MAATWEANLGNIGEALSDAARSERSSETTVGHGDPIDRFDPVHH